MIPPKIKQKKDQWQLLEVLNLAAEHLARRDFENPRLNAELLLCHTLGLKRLDLYLQYDRVLSAQEVNSYRDLLRERLKCVPLQYITGQTEFMSLPFSLNSSVFIPRPETEVLVEAVITKLRDRMKHLIIADIGTGCGAIAISIAHELEDTLIYATDISSEIIQVAEDNARKNGVADRITFLQGDMLDPLKDRDLTGKVDAIVSNPPYVRRGDIPQLSREIKDYEPILALDGGPDGLSFHRGLASESGEFLKSGGWLALEVGLKQASPVLRLIERSGSFAEMETVKDLCGVERVVLARRL